ncbi:MAG: hypothetical protein Kow0069_30060 [Promethearchaeota archaeon]
MPRNFPYYLVPEPQEARATDPGELVLDGSFELFHNKFRVRPTVVELSNAIRERFGVNLPPAPIQDRFVDPSFPEDFFFLYVGKEVSLAGVSDLVSSHLDAVPNNPQGYLIVVGADHLLLASRGEAGTFYGVQTLVQVLNQAPDDLPVRLRRFEVRDWPDVEVRGFQLDLKLLAHTFKYLKALVRGLAHYKFNAILLEYEDKFPYDDGLEVLRHKRHLTAQQVESLRSLCRRNFVEVIPLVQVFGHVPFVLKHEEFAHLRELPEVDWSYCPLKEGSLELASKMVRQVCRAHPESKYFHLGCDEVYQLGRCPQCAAFVENFSKSKLFVDHVNKLAAVVREEGKVPLVWSDYLIKYPEALDQLDRDVAVTYWVYWTTTETVPKSTLLARLPGHLRELYEPYLRVHGAPDESPALPFFEFFKDRGFTTFGAPSVSSDFQLGVPRYGRRLANAWTHASRVADLNLAGVLVTSWAVCANPLETQWPGVLWSAWCTWKVTRPDDEALRRASDAFWVVHFGVPAERLGDAFPLLVDLAAATPGVDAENCDRVVDLIDDLVGKLDSALPLVRKNATTLVALVHGLGGPELLARLLCLLKELEGKIAEADDAGEVPTPGQFEGLKFALAELGEDVKRYYEDAKKVYEKTGIMHPGELFEVYSQKDHRYLGWIEEVVEDYQSLLRSLPESFEELLLRVWRDLHA